MKKNFLHPIFFFAIIFFGMLFLTSVHAQSETDVFVLKDIIIPADFGPHQTTPDPIQFVIMNKRAPPLPPNFSVSVDVSIKDKTGAVVYSQKTPSLLVSTFVANTGTINLLYSTISATPVPPAGVQFVDGDTYTLVATATRGRNSSGALETVTGNNTATKTFVSLKPNQSYSIPDSPWWMSLAVVFVVVGGLFISKK